MVLGVLVIFLAPSVGASPDTVSCAEIVQAALQSTDDLCSGTGRNQTCYGHEESFLGTSLSSIRELESQEIGQ